MIKIHMWCGGNRRKADKIDITFYDFDCTYRGNIYMNGKIVGDYVCDDSIELEKTFPQLVFNWN